MTAADSGTLEEGAVDDITTRRRRHQRGVTLIAPYLLRSGWAWIIMRRHLLLVLSSIACFVIYCLFCLLLLFLSVIWFNISIA